MGTMKDATPDERYTIERMLGATPCGPVSLATDTIAQRPVALFDLPAARRDADPAAYARCLARFRRGAEVSRLVRHPNLAETYDCVEGPDGGARCVMEYVDGPGLNQLLARGPVSTERALAIAADICRALAALHAREVVHRNVALAHIRIAPDGAAKLTGYGDAQIGRASLASGLGMERPGTPGYISPEQDAGLGGVDGRSDLYSLGAVLYAMLAGEPYARQQRPLAAARPDLSAPVAALVAKLLERQPAFRYQRAEDVLRDLGTLLPPTTTPDAAAPRAPSTAPAPVPAATSLPSLSVVIPPPMAPAPSLEPPLAHPALSRPRGRPYWRTIGIIAAVIVGVFVLRSMIVSPRAIRSPTAAPSPTVTGPRVTPTRVVPTPTARVTGAAGSGTVGSAAAGQGTPWTDPKGRITFVLPPGWSTFGTGSKPDDVVTLSGDDVIMVIKATTPTQSIAAEFAALRTSQSAAGGTFIQDPVIPVMIGGEPGQFMGWQSASTSTTTGRSETTFGGRWLVDHNGKRFSFSAAEVASGTAWKTGSDALIASVRFPV
ncbi:MAG: serine/threonine protein kinase [Thermomicrobiales bacterium]